MSCHFMPQSCKFIEEHMAIKVEKLGKETLINCAKTAMSSKVCALPAAGMRCQHITGLGIKCLSSGSAGLGCGRVGWVAS